MVTPSVAFDTDLNNDCGGATTGLGTMQYTFYRILYWMVQNVGGSGASVITRSSNGTSFADSDLITGVGAGAVVFNSTGNARSWATGTAPAGFGNVFGGGRLYWLMVAESTTPLNPLGFVIFVAPNQFTGGSTTVLPTATGQSGSVSITLRSNSTVGAFRLNIWKNATGDIFVMDKLLVDTNNQGGFCLFDLTTSTQTNRFIILNSSSTPNNITSWTPLVANTATTMTSLASTTLISVATGLTQLTNGIDNTARMPGFPISFTNNVATVSGGRPLGTLTDVLAIGGNNPTNFNYGDPAETGTMRYRTMGSLMLPCPVGTVLE